MRTGIHTPRHTSATISILTFFTFAIVHYCLHKRYRSTATATATAGWLPLYRYRCLTNRLTPKREGWLTTSFTNSCAMGGGLP